MKTRKSPTHKSARKAPARGGAARTAARPAARNAARPAARNAARAAGGARAKAAPLARKPAAAIQPPDPAARMAAWQKAMTPNENHRRLDALVGTFQAKSRIWMSPEAPPMVGTGISEHQWVLGGRFVEQVYRGTKENGQGFDGIGYTGYDNVRKRYVGSWMDSMGTGIMTSLGDGKATADGFGFTSETIDPMSGKKVQFRCLVRIADRDRHSYEMWTHAPDGREYKVLDVEYLRK